MFKFGFGESNNEERETTSTTRNWREAEQVNVDQNTIEMVNKCSTKTLECHGTKLQYISCTDVVEELKKMENTNSVLRAEIQHSDLVTAEYEGGLKIWECTNDLISYFNQECVDFSNKKVLDLGCGAGLLGIYSLLKGSEVDFQDYNKEVVEYTTIPNVILNLQNDGLKLCRFYCGDWKSFSNLIKSKYDYILTSETIYNPDNYQKLYDIFDNLLNQNGVVYLAAKTYYFGVGGSVRQFEELINKNGLFESTVVWTNTEGVQREILKIFKK